MRTRFPRFPLPAALSFFRMNRRSSLAPPHRSVSRKVAALALTAGPLALFFFRNLRRRKRVLPDSNLKWRRVLAHVDRNDGGVLSLSIPQLSTDQLFQV